MLDEELLFLMCPAFCVCVWHLGGPHHSLWLHGRSPEEPQHRSDHALLRHLNHRGHLPRLHPHAPWPGPQPHQEGNTHTQMEVFMEVKKVLSGDSLHLFTRQMLMNLPKHWPHTLYKWMETNLLSLKPYLCFYLLTVCHTLTNCSNVYVCVLWLIIIRTYFFFLWYHYIYVVRGN